MTTIARLVTRFNPILVTAACILVLILIAITPARAQDITAEPTAIVTLEMQPTPPIPTPNGSTDSFVVLSVWQIVAGIAFAFSAGGLTIGTGVAVLASRLRNNTATMAAIEGLTASTPPETVARILSFADKIQQGVQETAALLREALDGIPVRDKTQAERDAVLQPPPVTAQSTAPLSPVPSAIEVNITNNDAGSAPTGGSESFPGDAR